MKRSYKPEIFKGIITVTTAVVFMLFYVVMKLRIDYMLKEISQLNQFKIQLNNRQVNLLVEMQELSSEQRIKSIAMEELGLVRRALPAEVIEIDTEFIREIKEELESNYE